MKTSLELLLSGQDVTPGSDLFPAGHQPHPPFCPGVNWTPSLFLLLMTGQGETVHARNVDEIYLSRN